MSDTKPTTEELDLHSLRTFKGIEVGLGEADPVAIVAAKLEAQHPGHLILVQAGKFLHGYDRTAYALSVLKNYKLKLVGIAADPHLRIGFPIGNFKRRLWTVVEEFGIPYVVALGAKESGRTIYTSAQPTGNTQVLESISPNVIAEVIHDLQQRNELNKAAASCWPARIAPHSSSRPRHRNSTPGYCATSSRCRVTCALPLERTCASAWPASCAA